jgi:hypothetical protein
MFLGEFPLSEFAYPFFWQGGVGFNPLLATMGVAGAVPGFSIAATYALVLGWLLWSALRNARAEAV